MPKKKHQKQKPKQVPPAAAPAAASSPENVRQRDSTGSVDTEALGRQVDALERNEPSAAAASPRGSESELAAPYGAAFKENPRGSKGMRKESVRQAEKGSKYAKALQRLHEIKSSDEEQQAFINALITAFQTHKDSDAEGDIQSLAAAVMRQEDVANAPFTAANTMLATQFVNSLLANPQQTSLADLSEAAKQMPAGAVGGASGKKPASVAPTALAGSFPGGDDDDDDDDAGESDGQRNGNPPGGHGSGTPPSPAAAFEKTVDEYIQEALQCGDDEAAAGDLLRQAIALKTTELQTGQDFTLYAPLATVAIDSVLTDYYQQRAQNNPSLQSIANQLTWALQASVIALSHVPAEQEQETEQAEASVARPSMCYPDTRITRNFIGRRVASALTLADLQAIGMPLGDLRGEEQSSHFDPNQSYVLSILQEDAGNMSAQALPLPLQSDAADTSAVHVADQSSAFNQSGILFSPLPLTDDAANHSAILFGTSSVASSAAATSQRDMRSLAQRLAREASLLGALRERASPVRINWQHHLGDEGAQSSPLVSTRGHETVPATRPRPAAAAPPPPAAAATATATAEGAEGEYMEVSGRPPAAEGAEGEYMEVSGRPSVAEGASGVDRGYILLGSRPPSAELEDLQVEPANHIRVIVDEREVLAALTRCTRRGNPHQVGQETHAADVWAQINTRSAGTFQALHLLLLAHHQLRVRAEERDIASLTAEILHCNDNGAQQTLQGSCTFLEAENWLQERITRFTPVLLFLTQDEQALKEAELSGEDGVEFYQRLAGEALTDKERDSLSTLLFLECALPKLVTRCHDMQLQQHVYCFHEQALTDPTDAPADPTNIENKWQLITAMTSDQIVETVTRKIATLKSELVRVEINFDSAALQEQVQRLRERYQRVSEMPNFELMIQTLAAARHFKARIEQDGYSREQMLVIKGIQCTLPNSETAQEIFPPVLDSCGACLAVIEGRITLLAGMLNAAMEQGVIAQQQPEVTLDFDNPATGIYARLERPGARVAESTECFAALDDCLPSIHLRANYNYNRRDSSLSEEGVYATLSGEVAADAAAAQNGPNIISMIGGDFLGTVVRFEAAVAYLNDLLVRKPAATVSVVHAKPPFNVGGFHHQTVPARLCRDFYENQVRTYKAGAEGLILNLNSQVSSRYRNSGLAHPDFIDCCAGPDNITQIADNFVKNNYREGTPVLVVASSGKTSYVHSREALYSILWAEPQPVASPPTAHVDLSEVQHNLQALLNYLRDSVLGFTQQIAALQTPAAAPTERTGLLSYSRGGEEGPSPELEAARSQRSLFQRTLQTLEDHQANLPAVNAVDDANLTADQLEARLFLLRAYALQFKNTSEQTEQQQNWELTRCSEYAAVLYNLHADKTLGYADPSLVCVLRDLRSFISPENEEQPLYAALDAFADRPSDESLSSEKQGPITLFKEAVFGILRDCFEKATCHVNRAIKDKAWEGVEANVVAVFEEAARPEDQASSRGFELPCALLIAFDAFKPSSAQMRADGLEGRQAQLLHTQMFRVYAEAKLACRLAMHYWPITNLPAVQCLASEYGQLSYELPIATDPEVRQELTDRITALCDELNQLCARENGKSFFENLPHAVRPAGAEKVQDNKLTKRPVRVGPFDMVNHLFPISGITIASKRSGLGRLSVAQEYILHVLAAKLYKAVLTAATGATATFLLQRQAVMVLQTSAPQGRVGKLLKHERMSDLLKTNPSVVKAVVQECGSLFEDFYDASRLPPNLVAANQYLGNLYRLISQRPLADQRWLVVVANYFSSLISDKEPSRHRLTMSPGTYSRQLIAAITAQDISLDDKHQTEIQRLVVELFATSLPMQALPAYFDALYLRQHPIKGYLNPAVAKLALYVVPPLTVGVLLLREVNSAYAKAINASNNPDAGANPFFEFLLEAIKLTSLGIVAAAGFFGAPAFLNEFLALFPVGSNRMFAFEDSPARAASRGNRLMEFGKFLWKYGPVSAAMLTFVVRLHYPPVRPAEQYTDAQYTEDLMAWTYSVLEALLALPLALAIKESLGALIIDYLPQLMSRCRGEGQQVAAERERAVSRFQGYVNPLYEGPSQVVAEGALHGATSFFNPGSGLGWEDAREISLRGDDEAGEFNFGSQQSRDAAFSNPLYAAVGADVEGEYDSLPAGSDNDDADEEGVYDSLPAGSDDDDADELRSGRNSPPTVAAAAAPPAADSFRRGSSALHSDTWGSVPRRGLLEDASSVRDGSEFSYTS